MTTWQYSKPVYNVSYILYILEKKKKKVNFSYSPKNLSCAREMPFFSKNMNIMLIFFNCQIHVHNNKYVPYRACTCAMYKKIMCFTC